MEGDTLSLVRNVALGWVNLGELGGVRGVEARDFLKVRKSLYVIFWCCNPYPQRLRTRRISEVRMSAQCFAVRQLWLLGKPGPWKSPREPSGEPSVHFSSLYFPALFTGT